ncbi:restriction endonuclease subunit S [Rhodococcus kronopolitis]|uniref:Restriction endonuclease subunit S n=1 Tax=Rhodococcus kronopolitis TaxID=1460226 RepID=A0ABV9FPE1_9NOCA
MRSSTRVTGCRRLCGSSWGGSMARSVTVTGGRDAASGVIPGRYALSVGMPELQAAEGFHWRLLTDLARLESGHTPRRAESSYWDGDVPWIGVRDATANHGLTISTTNQYITEAGLANSSARLLPAGTVCLSRTASVGYVVTMGVPMATSQDFVNWVCGPELSGRYLHYLLMVEQESIRRFAYGTTHQTMYYPEAKALHVCVPSRREQDAIAEVLGALDDKIAANRKLTDAALHLADLLVRLSDSWVPIGEVVEYRKVSRSPERMGADVIAHYSLPAFDSGQLPETTLSQDIKSAKFRIENPSVLISKLNPRFPRIWDVAELPVHPAFASTEFLVLESLHSSTSVLAAVLRHPDVSAQLEMKVAGTSGSHQRVKPDDLLATRIPDPRAIGVQTRESITSMGRLVSRVRNESVELAVLRDTLLPRLMSGELRVRDAERAVEVAL